MAGINNTFQSDFNEIPLFMDQHIRLAVGSGEQEGDDGYVEVFPIYFGWDDLVSTVQESMAAYANSGEEYEAAISVSDFKQVITQMAQECPVDFRNVAFIPATPKPLEKEEDDEEQEQ